MASFGTETSPSTTMFAPMALTVTHSLSSGLKHFIRRELPSKNISCMTICRGGAVFPLRRGFWDQHLSTALALQTWILGRDTRSLPHARGRTRTTTAQRWLHSAIHLSAASCGACRLGSDPQGCSPSRRYLSGVWPAVNADGDGRQPQFAPA